MARNNNQEAHVVVTLDGKQAETMLEQLNKRSAELRNEIKQLNDQRITTGLSGDEAKRFDQLKKDLRETRRTARETSKQVKDVGDVINRLSTAPIKAITDSIKAVETQMKRLDRSTERYAQKREQLRLLREELDRINGNAKESVNAFDQIGKTMRRLASYVLVYAGFNELTAGLRNLYDMNIRLSDQMADIQKTTGLYGQELEDLTDRISKLDTRTPVEQLNNLAVAAGKLGISAKEDIMGFVEAGDIINVALGEDLGQEAITGLSKLNDVLGITKELGVEQGLLATGSAINELGQSSTANESYLVDFAQRMGGIAAQAGLTIQEVLALGSAADQSAQNVEVAATALNKFVTTLVSETDQVATAVGIPLEKLREALDESTWKGMMLVFEELAGKGGLAGIAPLMGDLGSDGARLNAVISALTSNTQRLSDELKISNQAFAEGTSVINEFQAKNNSLAGIVQRITKQITNQFQSSDIVQRLQQTAVYIYDLTSEFDEFGNRIKTATNILATLFEWLVKLIVFISQNVGVIASLTAAFNAARIASVAVELALKAQTAALTLWTTVTKTATKAQLLLNYAFYTMTGNATRATAALNALRAASLANPWTALATALAAVGSAIYFVYQKSREASQEMARFRSNLQQSITSELSESEYLFSVVRKSAEGSQERRLAIEKINNLYKDYLPNLLDEKTTTEELAMALEQVNAQLQNKVVREAKEEEIKQVLSSGMLNQQVQFADINESLLANPQTITRIDTRIRELTESALQKANTVKEAARMVNEGIREEFGEAVQFTSEYYNSVYKYVEGVNEQNAKLQQIEFKYKPFERNVSQPSNVIPEILVTGSKSMSDNLRQNGEELRKQAEDAIKTQIAAIDLWLQNRKNALMEARQAQTDINSENYISEEEYNQAVLALEMQAMEQKLQILGLEPKQVAQIRGQILEIRQQMYDDVLETQQQIEQILLDADPVAKENKEYEERLRALELFGEERENLTEQQLEALEILNTEHAIKIREAEAKLRRQQLRAAEESFKQLVENNTGTSFEGWNAERYLQLDEMQQALDYERGLGATSETEAFNRQMEIHNKRLGMLQEELDMRKQVGADTSDVLRQISRVEGQMTDESAQHFKELSNTYMQYGSQIGDALGEVITGQEDAWKGLADTVIDILFDILAKQAQIWIAELAATQSKTTGEAVANAVGKGGILGIAQAAILTGVIAAAIATAKAGIQSAIKGGSGSSSASGSTGQRVIKTTGYSTGGHTGNGPTLEVAGVVHRGEYVVPKWQMQDPVSFDYVRALETIRRSRSSAHPLPHIGFAEGGPTDSSVSIIPTEPNLNNDIQTTLNQLNRLLVKLNRDGVRTVFNISNFDTKKQQYENSKARGSLKN